VYKRQAWFGAGICELAFEPPNANAVVMAVLLSKSNEGPILAPAARFD